MIVTTEINTDSIAAKLAHCDDIDQAKFFDIFFNELYRHCETHYHAEMQLQSIRSKLRDLSVECIKTIGFEDENS